MGGEGKGCGAQCGLRHAMGGGIHVGERAPFHVMGRVPRSGGHWHRGGELGHGEGLQALGSELLGPE